MRACLIWRLESVSGFRRSRRGFRQCRCCCFIGRRETRRQIEGKAGRERERENYGSAAKKYIFIITEKISKKSYSKFNSQRLRGMNTSGSASATFCARVLLETSHSKLASTYLGPLNPHIFKEPLKSPIISYICLS